MHRQIDVAPYTRLFFSIESC